MCIKEAHLGTDSRVLNVGSGLGGPARYFGGKLGASVLAVELQDDLHRTAAELTARCGLNDNVHHLVRHTQHAHHTHTHTHTHTGWLGTDTYERCRRETFCKWASTCGRTATTPSSRG